MTSVEGLTETEDSAGVTTVRPAVFVEVPSAATTSEVPAETAVTAKTADDWPSAIATVAGTAATAGWLDVIDTLSPPAIAGCVRVTVAVEEVPAITVCGSTVSELTPTTMTEADLDDRPSVAVMEASPGAAAVAWKATELAPEGTVTFGVTAMTAGLLESKLTTVPAGPAGASRVTVPVAAWPGTRDAGCT
jgi:hypothetical protein